MASAVITKTQASDRVKARAQRKGSAKGKIHQPNLERFYRSRVADVNPGEYRFELDLLNPGLEPFRLRTVESLSWDDEASGLSGSITVHRPVPGDAASLPVHKGQLVRCRVRTRSGAVHQLWTMRAKAPQVQLDTNTVTITLEDAMALLKVGKADWIYRRTKARPQGWTAAEITRDVATRRGLTLQEPLPECKKRFALVLRRSNAYRVLVKAWAEELGETGVPYVMRMQGRDLSIVRVRRNPVLYVLGRQIQTALLQPQGGQSPTTVLVGHAKIGKGKDSKRIQHIEQDRSAIKLLGFIRTERDYGTVQSRRELERKVKRDLARALQVRQLATVQAAGIPWIRVGDGEQLDLPTEGYAGLRSFVFCVRANHTVQAGTYTTSWDFHRKDPYVALARAAKKAKAGAAVSAKAGAGHGARWLVPASAEDDPPGTTASCGPLPADRRGYSVLSASGTSGDAATAGQALSVGSTWPCGATLIVTNPANNRSVAVKHVDNGAGSDAILPVIGLYPQTRADLGLDESGSYQVIIEAGGNAPTPQPARGHTV